MILVSISAVHASNTGQEGKYIPGRDNISFSVKSILLDLRALMTSKSEFVYVSNESSNAK